LPGCPTSATAPSGGRPATATISWRRSCWTPLAQLRPADVEDRPDEADARGVRVAQLTAALLARTEHEAQLRRRAAEPGANIEFLLGAASEAAAARKGIARELEELKRQGSGGRVEALAEVQTLRELRDSLQGEERRRLEERIQGALPAVLAEVWLQAQPLAPRRQLIHAQLFLRNGQMIYRVLFRPGVYRGELIWDLLGHDLRAGPFGGPG
jgi:hypothetical protein